MTCPPACIGPSARTRSNFPSRPILVIQSISLTGPQDHGIGQHVHIPDKSAQQVIARLLQFVADDMDAGELEQMCHAYKSNTSEIHDKTPIVNQSTNEEKNKTDEQNDKQNVNKT